MTSRQLSPSPATRRNHSPASLSLQSSFSKDSSFLASSVVACRRNLSRGSLSLALAASRKGGNGSVSENRSRNENGGSEVVAVAKPEEFLRECGLGRVHVAMAWHFLLQKHRYGWIRPGL